MFKSATYQRSNSWINPRSVAIVGSATVRMPDPIVFRKFTPATVTMIKTALLFDKISLGGFGWSICWWDVSSGVLFRSRMGRGDSSVSSELSSTVIVEEDAIFPGSRNELIWRINTCGIVVMERYLRSSNATSL
jgi:hypothetical protein